LSRPSGKACSSARSECGFRVGIEMRRAHDLRVRWLIHQFPDGPQSGSLITPFPQASLRSRTVEFPESGSDLGPTPRSSSWEERGLSADSHAPLLNPVYFQGRSVVHRPHVLLVRLLLEPPSAQSPFARSRCYLSRRGVAHHISGHYPTFLATTGSCASPRPSPRLGFTLGQRVFAGCCQPRLGKGPSRR